MPRPRTFLPKALMVLVLAAPASGTAMASGGGGVAAPPGGGSSPGGGSTYGEVAPPEKPAREPEARRPARPERPRRKQRRRPARRRERGAGLVLASFELRRPRLFLYGRAARVDFRIQGRAPSALVRLAVLRASDRAVVKVIGLGRRATGVSHAVGLTGREGGALPQGRYLVRISARDARGRGLRRSASAGGVRQLSFFHHVFPLAGAFTYGGADGGFGAPRRGHRHQGHDLSASEGTPVVAPRGGVVRAVQYQAAGAGHYVVLRGEGENRDYVFMHLRAGSIPVRAGERVRTGQRLGEVGNTGRSFGAHLHFEVWVGGWYSGGRPVDPLPLLRRWDSWS